MAQTGTLTVTVRDYKGKVGNFSVNLPDTTNPADALTVVMLQGLVTTAADLINGQIEGLSYTVPMALPAGLPASPNAASDVEAKARFLFESAEGFRAEISLPTYNGAGSQEDTAILDEDNAVVAAFADAIVDGPYTTNHSEAITAFKKAYQTFANSKGRVR